MADDKIKVGFEGDTTGVEAAVNRTNAIIDGMRGKLQAQNSVLGNFARSWATAFGVPTSGRAATQFLDTLGTKADQAKGKVTGLQRELRQLGTGAGLAILAKEAADMADVWTRSRNLLSATGVATGDLASRQSELVEMAIRTRTALEPTVSLYSRMYRALTPLGAAEQDVARAVEITNMAFKAGGAAVSEQNAAILQLSQALGAGLLQGDELRSVRENAPLIAKAIAEEFDTTIAGLKKLGSEGKLVTDRVFKGILDGGEEIEKQFARTSSTISDSFNNLRTRLIEYVGNTDRATGASKLLTGAIQLIANNLNLLIDAAIVAATVLGVNFARQAVVTVIAQLLQMRAQLIFVNTAFAANAVAANAASRGIFTMATATGVLRGALSALMGPIGIVLAVGTALGVMATQGESATDEIEKLRAKLQETEAIAESFIATVEEWKEIRANEMVGDFGDLNGQVETANERVQRLKKTFEDMSVKKFDDDLKKADTAIKGFKDQIYAAEMRWRALSIAGQSDPLNIKKMNDELAYFNEQLDLTQQARNQLIMLGDKGYDQKSKKDYIQAVYDEYEFREFAARNNEAKLIQILAEKAQTAKKLFGDESKEYIDAVNDKEKAEASFARTQKERSDASRKATLDRQKDILEAKDTELEANEQNKGEWLKLMQEKLALLRQFYGESSREYQRGLQEEIRMKRKFQDEENRIASEGIELRANIARGVQETEFTIAQSGLERKRALVQQALDQDRITAEQAIVYQGQIDQQEIQLEIVQQTKLYELARNALQEKMQLQDMEPRERAKILNELIEMENAFNQRIKILRNTSADAAAKTQDQVTKEIGNSWKNAFAPVGSAVNGMFQNLYNGTMGWKDSFLQALDQILFAFVDFCIQEGIQWAAMEAMKTSATTAGVTARTAAETAGATTSQAISAESALGQILNYAWTAASGAFSALAGIPVIGPVLAVGAGAAALATVLGFAGNILSAEGGLGEVPADGTITELHKEEMVLPAKFANPLRGMLTGQVGMPLTPGTVSATAGERADFFRQNNTSIKEGDTILNYQPVSNVNNVSLASLLRKDGLAMRKWMQNFQRNQAGGRPKKSA